MQSDSRYALLASPEEIGKSFEVMREMRPHLQVRSEYVDRVIRQQEQGYMLLGAWEEGEVLGLAGYRRLENLLYGRFTYVDDLVVPADARRAEIGGRLLEEVRQRAKAAGDGTLVLDTGLANALAQKFYFREGLLTRGLHFSQTLS